MAKKDSLKELERIDNALNSLHAEALRISQAPISFDDAIGKINVEVDTGKERALAGLKQLANSYADVNAFENFGSLAGSLRTNEVQYRFDTLYLIFNEQIKKGLAAALRSVWPAESISTKDKNEELEKLRARRSALEKAREEIRLNAQSQGLELDPRADCLPDVFLNFAGGKKFDSEKLETLTFTNRGLARALSELNQECGAARSELRRKETVVHQLESNPGPDREPFGLAAKRMHESEVEKLRRHIARLEVQSDPIQARLVRLQRVENSARNFLMEKGIVG